MQITYTDGWVQVMALQPMIATGGILFIGPNSLRSVEPDLELAAELFPTRRMKDIRVIEAAK